MLKNFFRLILLLITAGLVLLFLFLFDLPPFNQNSSTANPAPDINNDNAAKQAEEAALPANLKDKKVTREKSYEEALARAKQLQEANFPTLAIAEYQYAYSKNSQDLNPLFQIGKIYLRINNYSKAQTVFEEILRKEPNNTEAKIYLTRSLLGQREISKAKEVISTITTDTQTSLYYKGIIAAYFGEHEVAKKSLETARSQNVSADISKKAANFLAAYEEYGFSTESPNIHLKVLLARSYNQTGEYQMAIPLLFEVTKEKLDYRDAWVLLGYAYLQTEKYQDAIEALQRAKILDSEKPETNFFLGLAYFSINNYQKAQELLTKAKENGFEPKVQIDQKLAEIYLQLQSYDQSAAAYEAVLTANKQDIDYYIRPIWIYIEKTKQPQKALELASKGLRDHPGQAMSHNLMGWALLANQDYSAANKELEEALKLNPYLDAAHLNQGQLFEQTGKYLEAINSYKKAHQLGNGNSVSELAATRYNRLIAKNPANYSQANVISP